MNSTRNSGNSGEKSRQRVGRYMFGVGVLSVVAALYLANYWRTALLLASIGIIVAFVGAMLQTA